MYKSLVRPNLILGIPREYFYLAGLFSIVVWMASNNMIYALGSMLIWLPLGFLWAKVDPDFMGIYLAKFIVIKPNNVLGESHYPEIIIPSLMVLSLVITQSMTTGFMSILIWVPLYFRLSDSSTEYQA